MLKNIIAIIVFMFFFTMATFVHGIELTSQETTALNQFFRYMLEQSEGGYVIFDS